LREIAVYRVRQILPVPAWIATPLAALGVANAMLYAKLADGLDLSQVAPVASIDANLAHPRPQRFAHASIKFAEAGRCESERSSLVGPKYRTHPGFGNRA
jgi:hypothetical protein